MARAIDADRLKQAIDHDYYEHYTKYHDSDQTALIDMVMDDIDEMPTLTPPNEPLTLKELREMSYTDWAWVVFPELPPEENKWVRASQLYSRYSHEYYGKTWIAYRRPPEVSP